MSLTDEQKAQAVEMMAKGVATVATMVGVPIAGDTATALGALVVDGITNGTLNQLVAHAQAKAAEINSEAAAELAARART